jgi:hypothetical protein
MGLPSLTLENFPYIALVIFIVIIGLRGLEYAKSGSVSQKDYNKYHPFLVQWLIQNNLGALVPVLSLFGVSQYSAPKSVTGGVVVIILSTLLLIFFMFVAELWYGHLGFILIFLVSIMAGTYVDSLQSYGCLQGDALNIFQQYGTGSVLMVFFAAACINIFSSGGAVGIVIGSILHVVKVSGLIALDYYLTFKKQPAQNRLCLSIFHHAFAYLIGFSVSLLMLGFAYATVLSYKETGALQTL